MGDNKNSFLVYAADIKETLDDLTDEQVGKLFRGMVDYQVTGETPTFSGELKFAFIPIRQQMDRDNTKWQQTRDKRTASGRKGGIRSGEVRKAKAKGEANEANEANASTDRFTDNFINEANEAVNVNVNVNDNVNVNVSDSFDAVSDGPAPLSSSLISYLNEKAGTNYNVTVAVVSRIGELLDAGYTGDDMRAVIDKKVAEWKDSDKMRSYLRPRTLFGDKFEEYAAAPVPVEIEKEQEKADRIVRLQEQRKSESESLSEILGRMQIIRDGPGGVKADWENYRELSDQKAIREQNIEIIDQRLGRLTT